MKKAVILQYRLLHYRTGLFDGLRARCFEAGIQLQLVHGQPTKREEKRRDTGSLAWADPVRNRYFAWGRRDVLWQPFPSVHNDADLVIFMQEDRLLSNYPWLFLRNRSRTRVAYWGHGRNLQSPKPNGALERWKKMLISKVDWWFAYTDMTRDILAKDGYPLDRITVLNNAIDNEAFEADLAACSADTLRALRKDLCLGEDALVGLFCGSLWAAKLLGFMVEAADRIREVLPNFHLVVIGDGPDAFEIREAAASRPWLHWVGVRRGAEKAAYFRLSDVVINPGTVGLHVLDSFCAGVPMVTTGTARHSPEVAYLRDGYNGMVVHGSAKDYADAVTKLLSDRATLGSMRANALADAKRYTLQNMIERFAGGIEQCLATPKKR